MESDLKVLLIQVCKAALEERIVFLKRAIDETQQEANRHKGAMQSRYDTFKEEAQYLRGGYEKQLQEVLNDLLIINKIIPKMTETIQLGTIVETLEYSNDGGPFHQKYFIATSIANKPVRIGNDDFICIRFSSPFITALKGKNIGDHIDFRDKQIEIVNIF